MEKIKTKICSHCKKELDINCFYKRRTSKDGLQNMCKECQKKEVKKISEKNKEKNKIVNYVGYKICVRCQKKLKKINFSKKIANKDGLYIYCKICSSEIYQINKKKKEGKKNESC